MLKGKKAGESAIVVEVEKNKSYFWCSCGLSSKQPFCDGSHKNTEFSPVKFMANETKKNCSLFFYKNPSKLHILFISEITI